MTDTLQQIQEEFFNHAKLVEVLDKAEIERMAKSKTSCCWHAGERVGNGWVVLCTPSGADVNGKMTVYVCRESNYS